MLVSEVMLQQTQVTRVVSRWERFVRRWPSPAACAAAGLGEVLAEWQGLGYPRRARDLHLAARTCVGHHDGEIPATLGGLLALPGVGPYTARAVLAFAFEVDVGVVDTNIARVLARRAGRRLRRAEAQEAADAWVPPGRSWEWNQTLMDLGAIRCRPRPCCDGCPVACGWRAAGHPDPDPAVGSAAVSTPQSRFVGSDRQLRGRVLAAVLAGEAFENVRVESQDRVAGDRRIAAAVASLVADGLLVRSADGHVRAP